MRHIACWCGQFFSTTEDAAECPNCHAVHEIPAPLPKLAAPIVRRMWRDIQRHLADAEGRGD